MDCEGCDTSTSREQCECEQECATFLQPISFYSTNTIKKLKRDFSFLNEDNEVCLLREAHVEYLQGGLKGLSAGYVSLDASKVSENEGKRKERTAEESPCLPCCPSQAPYV